MIVANDSSSGSGCGLGSPGGSPAPWLYADPFPGAIPTQAYRLAPGDAGIEQTIHKMQQIIDAAAIDPTIRAQALDIVRSVPANNPHGDVAQLFFWEKGFMRFTKDPAGFEVLYTPLQLLESGAGDCDDYCILLCTLLKSLGYDYRLVTLKADPREPGRFSHIYLEAEVEGRWIPLDATQRQAYPGWAPPRYFFKKIWESVVGSRASGIAEYHPSRADQAPPRGMMPVRRRAPRAGLGCDCNGSSARTVSVMAAGMSDGDSPATQVAILRRHVSTVLDRYGRPAATDAVTAALVRDRIQGFTVTPMEAAGLGQDGSDDTAEDIADVISAGGQAASQIITAARQSPMAGEPTGTGATVTLTGLLSNPIVLVLVVLGVGALAMRK